MSSADRPLPGFALETLLHENRRRAIFRAVRRADGLPVVLKRLRDEHASIEEIGRLRHEHAMLTRVAGPGVLVSLGLVPDGAAIALLLEDFGARPLSGENATGALDPARALSLFRRVVEALAPVHAVGLVHRDVNPNNVLVCGDVVKLADFELADDVATVARDGRARLFGTIPYLAPEQTGRIGRGVDERADLYSLGATFHHLMSGRPPFEGHDAAELVHAHIARIPEPPPGPPILQAIVARLLAKNPDDRYQSCLGLLADLDRAGEALSGRGPASFPLGEHDRADRLVWPQRLFGREDTMAAARRALDDAREGRAAWVRISGWSGVGKTSVAEALKADVVRAGGFVASGKFERFRRAEPWGAVHDALRPLLAEVIAARTEDRAALTARVLQLLGAAAAVLVDDLPELAALLPGLPTPEPLLAGEARVRHSAALRQLVAALASPARPLMLFLDDLQWADLDSLGFLEALLADGGAPGMLAVAAWRDNEIGADHPLRATLAAVERGHGAGYDLHVGPLLETHVTTLLAAALDTPPGDVAPLASALCRATGGNPFHLRRLVEALRDEGLLRLEGGSWHWDLAGVAARRVDEDVASLLAHQLASLPEEARDAMRLGAFLGANIDLLDLSAALDKERADVAAALHLAARAGLVHLDGAGWAALRDGGDIAPSDATATFVHDSVQAACYALCPESQRREQHLRVARLLRPSLDARPDHLLPVADHLLKALPLIDVFDARVDAAQVFARATEKALKASAFAQAGAFAEAGLSLLPGYGWDIAPPLAWALQAQAVMARNLVADFARADELLVDLEARPIEGPQFFDRLGLRMSLEGHRGNLPGVVDAGLVGLTALGAALPRNPPQDEIAARFGAVMQGLGGRDPSALAAGPWCDDALQLGAQKLMFVIGPCTYLTQQGPLWQTLALDLVQRALTHGTTPFTTYGSACMGLILCGGLGMYPEGAAWGRGAIAVANATGSAVMRASANFHYGGFVAHWTEPLMDAVAIVE
jgi:predicted ATPase